MNNTIKIFISLALFFSPQFLSATLITRQLDSVVNATKISQQFDVNGDFDNDIAFTYFLGNGAISVSGKVNSFIVAQQFSGVNYKASKILNNSTFNNSPTWRGSTGAFLHNEAVGIVNEFNGKGNQYLGGRLVFGFDTVYYWFLINLNASGTELKIIKYAYNDDPTVKISTGNEGQSGTGIDNPIYQNFSVYPQPARESISINFPENSVGFSYQIFSQNGQNVLQGEAESNSAISVATLSKGIYILNIKRADAVLTKKIFIE